MHFSDEFYPPLSADELLEFERKQREGISLGKCYKTIQDKTISPRGSEDSEEVNWRKEWLGCIVDGVEATSMPQAATRVVQPKLKLLVHVCFVFQRLAGDTPFALDCRTVGELVGTSHMQAWRWMNLLISKGILKLVSRGGWKVAREGHKSNLYRFLGD